MEVRILKEEDYDSLCKWWKWWRFSPPERDFLPLNGTGGIMVSVNGEDVCAGFMYTTDSSVCLIEYVVSNPDYKENNRNEIVRYTVMVLTQIAKNNGFKYAFATMKSEAMMNSYESCGYRKGTIGCTELVKVL